MFAFHHVDRQLGQVADDRLDVPADISDFGELRRFHLDKRRLRQPGQPTGNLGFTNTRRTDHDDVFRHHLVAQLRGQLLPTPSIPQRNGDHPLGLSLADHIAVKLFHNLSGGQAVDIQQDRGLFNGHEEFPSRDNSSIVMCWLV